MALVLEVWLGNEELCLGEVLMEPVVVVAGAGAGAGAGGAGAGAGGAGAGAGAGAPGPPCLRGLNLYQSIRHN